LTAIRAQLNPRDQAKLLDTPGAAQIAHINTVMDQVGSWWELTPDQTHSIVTSGYGTVPTANTDPTLSNYCTTAANGYVSLTYCPQHTSLTVDMSKFAAGVTGRWYDPSSGSFITIPGGPFQNSGSRDFTMPGDNANGDPDWLLLLTCCSPDISANSASFSANGGAHTFNVAATPGCGWKAKSNRGWIEISSDKTGSGSSTINFTVRENYSPIPRTGTITVAGQSFTVTQDGESALAKTNTFSLFRSHPLVSNPASLFSTRD
jgi:Putative binding domain, N-terminal/Putative collagen-binding domain of a collagenase